MPDVNLPDYREPRHEEEVIQPTPPLSLDIPEGDLLSIISRRIKDSESFFNDKLRLNARRKKNEEMWVGKQIEDESQFYNWQIPYKDNVIWQDLETRIAISASRLPDIIVTPTDASQVEFKTNLEKALTLRINSHATRRLIKDGLRHLHLDFQGVAKVRWDENKGENGDYIFEIVHPDNILVDRNATYPQDGFTADNMEFIAEWIEEPIAVVVNKFPNKRQDLFRHLGIVRGTPRQLASKIRYREVWFTYYDSAGKKLEGVCWIYKDLLLDKSKHPYHDWEGYRKKNQQGAYQQLYYNHFDQPRKPYIFFTYQSLGKHPMDDTTAVEQAIPLQKSVNKRGRQITELSDRAAGKLAFAGKYITKDGARQVTWDPDEHIYLDKATDIRQALTYMPGQTPSPILYQDLVSNRLQIDSKFATHATTRGEVQPQESGISKQITREGDLAIQDDLANITVERVIYEMVNWSVQMMKVLYDEEHFVRDIGKDGEIVNITLKRDLIADGVAVNVKASSVDKAQRRADALGMAAQKAIDPLSLYEDLDVPNPKERTKRLLAFVSGDMNAYAQVVGLTEGQGVADPGQQQAILDIQRLSAGEDVQPTSITPSYIQTIDDFVNSPDYQTLSPDIQQLFVALVGKLRAASPPAA